MSPGLGGRSDTAILDSRRSDRTVVVCGAGGFTGGPLVADLLRQGVDTVRAVDIKPPNQWFQSGWGLSVAVRTAAFWAVEPDRPAGTEENRRRKLSAI